MFEVGQKVTRVARYSFGGVCPSESRVITDIRNHMLILKDSDHFKHDPAHYVLTSEYGKMLQASTKASNPKEAVGSTKLPLHLIPDAGIAHLSMAFYEGATKYGSYNWREAGVRAGTYIAAARRHLSKWWNGDDCDPKTKVHHLANAAACCLILMDAEVQGMLNDDRPPKQDLEKLYEKIGDIQAHLTKMHEGINPKHCTAK